jgi:hypothetical protein
MTVGSNLRGNPKNPGGGEGQGSTFIAVFVAMYGYIEYFVIGAFSQLISAPRLYSKVWPMLSIFDSNKQKTPLEISVVFDRWGAVLYLTEVITLGVHGLPQQKSNFDVAL